MEEGGNLARCEKKKSSMDITKAIPFLHIILRMSVVINIQHAYFLYILTACHVVMEDIISRAGTPRLPWHDVHACVMGPAAGDIARHFLQRWNYCKVRQIVR